MKEGLTELVFILDKSGSMIDLTKDTIGGYNSLLEKQKKEQGEARVTTVLFSNKYEKLYDNVDINEVALLTEKEYFTTGSTALLDAVGTTIKSVGQRLHHTKEEERPSQVIVVIITDGYENSSVEFTKEEVKEMVEHQQNKYNWIFMFIGANIDDIKGEGASIGISQGFTHGYSATSKGVNSVYSAVSNSIGITRGMSNGVSNSVSYSQSGNTSATVNREELIKQAQEALNDIE